MIGFILNSGGIQQRERRISVVTVPPREAKQTEVYISRNTPSYFEPRRSDVEGYRSQTIVASRTAIGLRQCEGLCMSMGHEC